MDAAAPMGAAVTGVRRLLAAVVLVLACAAAASAAERYVLVVVGVAGSETHAKTFAAWRDGFVAAVSGPLRVPADHVVVLSDRGATRDAVRDALAALGKRVQRDDTLLVVLIGHGTYDGTDAKFDLAGPDLGANEWKSLLQPISGLVVFVNTSSASAPFLGRIAGPRRVVITATDTPAQQYDTVFAGYFLAAFTDESCDLDKDRRVSIGEAFTCGATRTRRSYEQRGQLATERAVLDDDGDGVGKEAGDVGNDGAVASRVFLDPNPDVAVTNDPALSELLARRDALESAIAELARKKTFMPADDYERELERLLVDLARLSRRIRSRS
jgi:hypothetical protein